MNSIKLITPPDKLYEKGLKVLVIQPSDKIKTELHNVLIDCKQDINVYVYEETIDKKNPEWLLDVFSMSDIVILDLDDLPLELKSIQGYFLAFTKTYWLTNGENSYYNKLNSNRIFDFQVIKNIINGDNFV